MRVLITGGAGFIGSHLVDRFVADGFSVRILDNLDPKIHPLGAPKHLPSNVEFVLGDINDKQVLGSALQGVDFVCHQAAYQDYMPDFSRFFQTNAVATALLYELIVQLRLPVRKVIVASSQAVYGEGQYECAQHGFQQPRSRSPQDLSQGRWEVYCPVCREPLKPRLLTEDLSNPFNQYAVSKLAQEKLALGLGWLYDIPTVALRYSITQGARQSLYNQYSGICRIFCSRALRNQHIVVYEDGLQTRDFVHVLDVVEANMLVLGSDDANFHTFNVGSGRATTVLEYCAEVLRRVPSTAGYHVSGEYRRGDNRHSVSTIDKLSRLGWRPRRGLTIILDDFLEWVDRIGGIPESLVDAPLNMRTAGVLLPISG